MNLTLAVPNYFGRRSVACRTSSSVNTAGYRRSSWREVGSGTKDIGYGCAHPPSSAVAQLQRLSGVSTPAAMGPLHVRNGMLSVRCSGLS